jgi:hypothetical protein
MRQVLPWYVSARVMASRSDRFSGASRRSTRSRSSSRRRRSHRCAARASAMAGDCCRLSGQVVLPLGHAAAGDLRPGELRLSPRPHRSAIADRPGASTSRFRTADRTIGTRRGGGIVALEPCCTGGIAPATPRGLSQRPSHVAGALTDLPGGAGPKRPLLDGHIVLGRLRRGEPHALPGPFLLRYHRCRDAGKLVSLF